MVAPVMVTKLYVPHARPRVVRRPRLLARLDAGLHGKLILVAAPAGSGKTTLIGDWVAGRGLRVAWLSLDAGDRDPARFLTYLVAALRTIAPEIGAGVLGALQSPPPPAEVLLTALLNELAALPGELVLVLDDYHLVDATPVDEAVTFLLAHLPPRLHLVVATREDPPLPLAKLRGRGELAELRAADLRFTPDEAAEFLNAAMGLDLAAADVAALEARTEGWVAGLQLAALSLQGRDDAAGFIRAFAGDDRYVADYLVEEVLRRQPAPVRDFLLHTAILDRLSGPLCDAVTGLVGGGARLARLERGNFFVVPLDDRRHWYRYHHLFADVLRAHLVDEQPDRVPELHRRASAWYAQYGTPTEAIPHALAAGDFARAAELIERAAAAMGRSRQQATVRGWLGALPAALVRDRPVLSVRYAHILLAGGELAGVEDHLRDAERWLDPTADGRARPEAPATALVVADEEAFRRLPASIAVARAGQALARGDVAGTVRHARRVLALAPADDQLSRGGATAFLGLAAWTSGDLVAAHRLYGEGMAQLHRAGNITDAIAGAIALADIRIAQGRLHEARRTYERALQLAAEQGAPALRGTADMLVGLAELHREWGDLDAAARHLRRGEEQGEHTGFPQHPYRRRVAAARLLEARGDPGGALALLDEAERRYAGDFFPEVRPVAALRARLWVAQGRVGDAEAWARERGLSATDDPSYLREFEHLTMARVLLARDARDCGNHTISQALRLLGRLLAAAQAGERTGSVLAILVLQALAHQAHGDLPAALVPLGRAMALAAPEGYVRLFVDEGAPMAQLLHEAATRGIMPDYTGMLLAAGGVVQPRAAGAAPRRPLPASPPSIEPLSGRELDVLRLFNTALSGPEIAGELAISLSTVRTHTKSIYGKLGVNSRRAAVARAAALGLL